MQDEFKCRVESGGRWCIELRAVPRVVCGMWCVVTLPFWCNRAIAPNRMQNVASLFWPALIRLPLEASLHFGGRVGDTEGWAGMVGTWDGNAVPCELLWHATCNMQPSFSQAFELKCGVPAEQGSLAIGRLLANHSMIRRNKEGQPR